MRQRMRTNTEPPACTTPSSLPAPSSGAGAALAAGLILLPLLAAGPAGSPASAPDVHAEADPPIRDLGTLGGDFSQATGVNADGWIVGASRVPPGRRHATSYHAFLWRSGRMRDLGTLGGTESEARDVNDRGQVVGFAQYDSVSFGNFVRRFHRAFLWEDGKMRRLGTLGGRWSRAHAINDRGQVVGVSLTEDGEPHAFLRDGGRMRDLGTLGGPASRAYDVDDRGRVVGASVTDEGEVHAFLWVDGEMRDLGSLSDYSRARAIGGAGLVVGASRTARTPDGRVSVHAVAWELGGGYRARQKSTRPGSQSPRAISTAARTRASRIGLRMAGHETVSGVAKGNRKIQAPVRIR